MRILYISYETGLAGPLLHAQILPHVKELSHYGYTFHLLIFESPKLSSEVRCQVNDIVHDLQSHDIKVWLLKRSSYLPSPLPAAIDSLRGILLGTYLVLRHKIDVIHARALIPGLIASWVVQLSGCRWIFDPRILHAEAGALAGRFAPHSRKFKQIYRLERQLAAAADGIRVESNRHRIAYSRSDISAETPGRYWLIPNATDLTRFKPDREMRSKMRRKLGLKDEIVVVYSGTFSQGRPNCEMAKFVSLASEHLGPVHFLILTYTPRDEVIQILQESGLKDTYTVASAKWQDVPHYLMAADFGIVFVDPVASRHSVPLKFAEYLASGLPVAINAGIGNTQDIIEKYNAGVILPDFTTAAMKKAVEELSSILANRGDARRRCRNAAEQELALSIAVGKLHEMYQSLAD